MPTKRSLSSSSSAPSRSARARAAAPQESAHIEQPGALLNLPVELVKKIHGYIDDPNDRQRFAQASRALWLEWGTEWVTQAWDEDWERGIYELERVPLFFFNDAVKGEAGFIPFYVAFAEVVDSEIVVHANAIDGTGLSRDDDDIYIQGCHIRGTRSIRRYPESFTFDFGQLRFAMRSADSALIRARLPCPVCDERGEVEAGNKTLIKIYSSMAAYRGDSLKMIDCPHCKRSAYDGDWDAHGDFILNHLGHRIASNKRSWSYSNH